MKKKKNVTGLVFAIVVFCGACTLLVSNKDEIKKDFTDAKEAVTVKVETTNVEEEARAASSGKLDAMFIETLTGQEDVEATINFEITGYIPQNTCQDLTQSLMNEVTSYKAYCTNVQYSQEESLAGSDSAYLIIKVPADSYEGVEKYLMDSIANSQIKINTATPTVAGKKGDLYYYIGVAYFEEEATVNSVLNEIKSNL